MADSSDVGGSMSDRKKRVQRIRGRLTIETDRERKIIYIDVDLTKNDWTVTNLPSNSIAIAESNFPVENLLLSLGTIKSLRSKGIRNLAKIPRIKGELVKLGFSPGMILEITEELGRLGYTVKEGIPDLLKESIDRLGLQRLVASKLRQIGIKALGDVITKSGSELLAFKGFGKRSLEKVKKGLRGLGLCLKPELKKKKRENDPAISKMSRVDEETAKEVLGEEMFYFFKVLRFGNEGERRQARNMIVFRNLGLVWKFASIFGGWIRDPIIDIDDLKQEGIIGLMRAIRYFDYTLGYRFATYAVWWIKQAMQRCLDRAGSVRIPIHMKENIRRVNKVREKLWQVLQRDPTLEEIAERLGWATETVLAVIDAIKMGRIISLEKSYQEDEENGGALKDILSDTKILADPMVTVDRAKLREKLQEILSGADISRIDRYCLEQYFGLDENLTHSKAEIGRNLGLTRERIRQLIAKVEDKLRTSQVWEELKEYVDSDRKPRILRFKEIYGKEYQQIYRQTLHEAVYKIFPESDIWEKISYEEKRCLELYFGLHGEDKHSLEEVSEILERTICFTKDQLERTLRKLPSQQWRQVEEYLSLCRKWRRKVSRQINLLEKEGE